VKKLEMREKFLEHIEKSHFIEIEREKVDEYSLHCLPIAIGERLALFKQFTDFSFDGFVIVRVKDLTKVRYDDVDKFAENILRTENLCAEAETIALSNLDHWKYTFKQLKELKQYIRIEHEKGEFIKYSFGAVLEVGNNGITFHCFGALGEWGKEPIEIQYKSIILVSIYDRYTRIFSKYVQKK
jgi:hypothetical protein